MGVQKGMPMPIAESRRCIGRLHDVGEEHCGEHSVYVGNRLLTGEETSDLVGNDFLVARSGRTEVNSWQFHEACVRNVVGKKSTEFDGNDRILLSMEHQRWNLDEGEGPPNIACAYDIVELGRGGPGSHGSPLSRG